MPRKRKKGTSKVPMPVDIEAQFQQLSQQFLATANVKAPAAVFYVGRFLYLAQLEFPHDPLRALLFLYEAFVNFEPLRKRPTIWETEYKLEDDDKERCRFLAFIAARLVKACSLSAMEEEILKKPVLVRTPILRIRLDKVKADKYTPCMIKAAQDVKALLDQGDHYIIEAVDLRKYHTVEAGFLEDALPFMEKLLVVMSRTLTLDEGLVGFKGATRKDTQNPLKAIKEQGALALSLSLGV